MRRGTPIGTSFDWLVIPGRLQHQPDRHVQHTRDEYGRYRQFPIQYWVWVRASDYPRSLAKDLENPSKTISSLRPRDRVRGNLRWLAPNLGSWTRTGLPDSDRPA